MPPNKSLNCAGNRKNIRMSGLFKIPNAPSASRGRPTVIRKTPQVAVPAQLNSAQSTFRGNTVKPSSVCNGNSVDKLMDIDESLLNAVDLAAIEQIASTPSGSMTGKTIPKQIPDRMGNVVLKESRLHPRSPEVSSPRRKKSRLKTSFITLDMGSASKRSQRTSALERDISRLDRFLPTQQKPNKTKSETFPPRQELTPFITSTQLNSGGKAVRDPEPVVPKVTTDDLFGCESLIFDSEVNRILNDDGPEIAAVAAAAEEEEEEELFPCYQKVDEVDVNCSQLFLEEVDRYGKKAITRIGTPLNSSETYSIVKNKKLCSQYIRLERSMLEENRANLVDDQVNSQLASEYDSTQKQREIENVFQEFERTMADMRNIVQQPDEVVEEAQALARIDWEENVTIAGDRSPARTMDRSRLNSIFNKRPSLGANNMGDSPKVVARKSAPLVSSHFQDKGPFFGLPSTVRNLLREYRGIKEMYDWQKECLGLTAIVERNNLIYALPTSGGKTLVAEIIMFREVMLRRKNAMFIVPYVSLAQEKLAALSPFAVAMEFLVEEYSGGKGVIPPRKRKKKQSIFVCTIEKALVLLDSLIEADRANEIGLVVIDELHMIGEDRRGVHLEILLTKIRMIEAGIQVVGMSATIGNLDEIARFMSADIYCRDFRPVELKEYVKCGCDLLEINSKARTLEDAFGLKQSVDYGYTEEQKRVDPDHVIALVLEVIPSDSCLIFCPTKRQCEQLCNLLTEHLPRELLVYKATEKEELINMLRKDGSTAQLLPAAFRLGIAYHHSGLTLDERKHIEDAYRVGIISLIICTSTLAAGVNLPAKRVIIRSPFIATNFMTLSRYKQMVGRAGRAGFGEQGDSILICAQKDISAVCNLLCSPMDEANSSLHADEYAHLKHLILSAVGLGMCITRNDIQQLVAKTLLAIQSERLGIDLRKVTDRAIGTLYKENAIKAKSDGCLRNPANMTIRIDGADGSQSELGLTRSTAIGDINVVRGAEGSSQEGKLVKTLHKNSRLEVNRLGKAAIRAGFHMDKAIRFYDELRRVGERLNVMDELHLLYVIVMEDGGEIRPSNSDYVAFFNQLSPDDTALAKRFHIGDFTISKILSRRAVPPDILPLIRRFYRVLIVYELWNLKSPQQVALKYKVDAGSVQTLMNGAASTASSLQRMCEEIQELWAFRLLLTSMVQRLSHCCTAELVPLMELPAVKIGRARQLYRAGFTSLTSIAKARSRDLVESVEHMSYRTANQLILSAKAKLMEEVEALKDQVEDYLALLHDR
ncbi:helicase POLQ-like [Topomyia yanbarensis]|uniref:helicase POLQ-like n=1 Tax=Topomyia yanbarensis TaxID=2498891 RepID=UPI00273A9A21|nr:helicase POLQ-like [Topomyia yanbarensis]